MPAAPNRDCVCRQLDTWAGRKGLCPDCTALFGVVPAAWGVQFGLHHTVTVQGLSCCNRLLACDVPYLLQWVLWVVLCCVGPSAV